MLAVTMDEPAVHMDRYHGLLGTVVEVRVACADGTVAAAAGARAVAEIARLESLLTVHDAGSELVRWRSGALDDPGAELTAVLALALDWQRRSGGAFNPRTARLSAVWRGAEADQRDPDPAVLDEQAQAIADPAYRVVDGRVRRLAACDGLDLNAIAKGWIVDRAVDAALRDDGDRIAHVVVNAGGDLRHRGSGAVRVGVEDPLRPFDNAAPIDVVTVANAAVATSGSARRGVRIGGRRHSHVIDPRTGRPVAHTASATVLAPDAATADAIATVAGVLTPDAALVFVDRVDGAAALVVAADGAQHRSARWPTASGT